MGGGELGRGVFLKIGQRKKLWKIVYKTFKKPYGIDRDNITSNIRTG